MEHYYQPEIECASREQIRAWQDERLANTVKRVYENVAFYRKKMEEAGVKPEDIRAHKLDLPVCVARRHGQRQRANFVRTAI